MTQSVRPSRRMHLSVRAGAAAAVLALAVTGCSSGDGNADPDTGAPGSTQSAPADATPTSTGSAGSTETSNATPEPTSTEFVPASSEGPAENVPVPEMPEAAREQTQEGLEAALEYWWEAAHYLKLTGDPMPLVLASTTDCALCSNLTDNWPQFYELGGWAAVSEPTVVVDLASLDNNDLGGRVLFTVSEKPSQVYNPDTSLNDEASGDGNQDTDWSAGAVYSQQSGNWKFESLETAK